ncbi:hypothetical protein TRIUR3_08804 [Triticum urartu]|uniref:Uncharacterized protein n=1 Tax=Triticum urartu TaxID=4572 RepID=M7Y853_TRIUA|nr:hypothetical protein TRIUR3_08804 [Triticum urartu]
MEAGQEGSPQVTYNMACKPIKRCRRTGREQPAGPWAAGSAPAGWRGASQRRPGQGQGLRRRGRTGAAADHGSGQGGSRWLGTGRQKGAGVRGREDSARGAAEVSGVTRQGGSQRRGGSALLQLRQTYKAEAGQPDPAMSFARRGCKRKPA